MKAGKESEGVTSNQRMCEFLLSYRTTPHSVTKVAPCMLFCKRDVRTKLHLLRGCLETEMAEKQMDQKIKYDQNTKERTLSPKEEVRIRNFLGDPMWIHGVVVSLQGPLSYRVQLSDGRIWRRYVEHLKGRSVLNPETSHVQTPNVTSDEVAEITPGTSGREDTVGQHTEVELNTGDQEGSQSTAEVEAGPPSVQLPAEVSLVANDKEVLGMLHRSQRQ